MAHKVEDVSAVITLDGGEDAALAYLLYEVMSKPNGAEILLPINYRERLIQMWTDLYSGRKSV